MDEFFKVATLTPDQVALIRKMEQATGTHVMAFEPGLKIATLSTQDLEKVKELEGQIGATLIVFEAD